MLGLKQEGLREDANQNKGSLLKAKEEIVPVLLKQMAPMLQVSLKVIKNFTEEAAVNYLHIFNDSRVNHGPVTNNN